MHCKSSRIHNGWNAIYRKKYGWYSNYLIWKNDCSVKYVALIPHLIIIINKNLNAE